MITIPIYLFILLELSLVTYGDIKTRKIPNLWTLLNLVLAGFFFVIFPHIFEFGFAAFQYSIVFIFVGFFLFLMKIMGGGDSKFLASFFLITPLSLQDQVFYFLLISTIIVGVIFLIKNIIQNRKKLMEFIKHKDVIGVKSCFGTKFAYAPVILITWILIGVNLFNKNF